MPAKDPQLVSLMLETARIVRSWMGPRRGTPGAGAISHVRLTTLKFVHAHDRPTMKDLATYLGIAAPSATLIVEGLAAQGLLRRVAMPGDRRSVRLSVTPKGDRALEAGIREMRVKLRTVVSRLTPKERAQLGAMLRRLIASYGERP